MKRVLAYGLGLGLLCLVAVASGCDRNIEPYVEGEQAAQPDLARMFPETDNGPTGEAVSQMPGAPRAGSMPAPPSEGAGSSASGTASGASISGRVEISAELAGAAPSGATLFVIARRAGSAGGPPLAVLRVADAELPLDFEIGPQHAMIQGMPFAGEIALTARLDGDGDAMTRVSGDLSGAVAESLQPGASGVRIALDSKL